MGLGRVVFAGREDGIVELRQHCVLTGLLLPPPRRRVLLRRRRLADQRALLGLQVKDCLLDRVGDDEAVDCGLPGLADAVDPVDRLWPSTLERFLYIPVHHCSIQNY